MNQQVRHALEHGRTIDITTIGRTSGKPRRIEIWFHNIDRHIYITGTPGRRDWYANLRADPNFTFHIKEGVQADLPARATLIEDTDAKRAILKRIRDTIGRSDDLETWVTQSPLIEVAFEDSSL
jgi:deazaflavin-dependent oxidoreductase (nitroreductase family)